MMTSKETGNTSEQQDKLSPEDLALLRAELVKGEQSGEPQPFDGEEFKKRMAAKHAPSKAGRKNGKLGLE